MAATDNTVRVWDPVVRIGHWVLVAAFFIAYLSEDDLLTQHVWAGYTVSAVVLIRILWGFVGTRQARFREFVRSPSATARYLGDILRQRPARYIGHNPAGGAMIVALLASLAVTSYSGLKIYAIEEGAGPLAAVPATATDLPTFPAFSPAAQASDDDGDRDDDRHARRGAYDENDEEFWEELHEASANFTLLLIVFHVAGVLLASASHRENLVLAMLTGRKRRQ